MKYRKIAAVLLACGLCLGFAGCGANGKDYETIQKAQEAVGELESGKLQIITSFEQGNRREAAATDFTFRMTEDGTLSYCHMQYDRNEKAVYCEYSDGKTSEHWLIGNGWSTTEPENYTREHPHRFLRLVSESFERKAVEKLEKAEEPDGIRYTLTLSPKKLNQTAYKEADVEILSEEVTLTISPEGQLLRYSDQSRVLEKPNGQEGTYVLSMTLSEQNAVSDVKKPELKNHYTRASVENQEDAAEE